MEFFFFLKQPEIIPLSSFRLILFLYFVKPTTWSAGKFLHQNYLEKNTNFIISESLELQNGNALVWE